MTAQSISDVPSFIRREFRDRGNIKVLDVEIRPYPDEINYIVFVEASDLPSAAQIGNDLDSEITTSEVRAFIIVRKAPPELVDKSSDPIVNGVQDERASELTRLTSARSRVSEAQPSLSYIRDAHINLAAITTPRHHLIFGRRGAGKTALLVEARSTLPDDSVISCWVNVQTLRNEEPNRVFLHMIEEVLTAVVSRQQQVRAQSSISVAAVKLYERVGQMLALPENEESSVVRLIPEIQRTIKRFLSINGLRLFIFVDDFYYITRGQQPKLLDMLHGCIRDCDAWLKIASIRHLTRWYQSSPPLGLQTMHDADLLDLDVTLQDPEWAKKFLENILLQYAKHVGVPALSRLFHAAALDRLVLASGAVPRDYLILAGSSIEKAKRRPNAKLVGVQDVNQAAGDAAQVKVQELEEDMASNVQSAARTLEALRIVRSFCLDETSHTYFLISYREKEEFADRYNVLTDLLDLRLIHLVDGGVSDAHAAGHRLEAFMLDLSQFSGSRLKQGIRVLDFANGRMLSRKTKGAKVGGSDKSGDTPLKLIAILRTAPKFGLERLAHLVQK
ncbi:hypothetical protein [[Actinomadura] parvosata]|uniref:hypothetical protein n=1 Tax=[Actinomadura] parvosata TaxID=1955412 RepID=UPI0012BCE26F|nr:hypothetical protein [Nonomuraea sp. ATCC 55076]